MQGIRTSFALVALTVVALIGLPTASSASSGQPGLRAGTGVDLPGCDTAGTRCIGFPDGCITTNTCTLGLTVHQDPADTDHYLFSLAGQFTGYVAVALGETDKMAMDSVVECIVDPKTSNVLVFQSQNRAHTNDIKNVRLPAEEQKGVTLVSGAFKDNAIACTFKRDKVTTVGEKTYDLSTGSWVLQVAAGNTLNADTGVHYHNQKFTSGSTPMHVIPSGASSASSTYNFTSAVMFMLLTTLSSIYAL